MDNKEIIYGLRYIIDKIMFNGFEVLNSNEDLSSSDRFIVDVCSSAIKFIKENSNHE